MFASEIKPQLRECLALDTADSYALVIKLTGYALDPHTADRDGFARLQRTELVP